MLVYPDTSVILSHPRGIGHQVYYVSIFKTLHRYCVTLRTDVISALTLTYIIIALQRHPVVSIPNRRQP